MMERVKWNHIKRVFEVQVFSSSQNIDFPFYLEKSTCLPSRFFINSITKLNLIKISHST
jgi:hypothetical protein